MRATFMKFLIYGFLGCLLEMAYCALLTGQYESRKCMLICFLCPVYGIGGITITKLCGYVKSSNLSIFIIGAITATLTEYLTHMFYDLFMHVYFWDYSDYFLNVNGRVCLLYSFMWGLLALAIVKYVDPHVEKIALKTSKPLAALVFAVFAADAIISFYLLNKYETRHAINLFMLMRAFIT